RPLQSPGSTSLRGWKPYRVALPCLAAYGPFAACEEMAKNANGRSRVSPCVTAFPLASQSVIAPTAAESLYGGCSAALAGAAAPSSTTTAVAALHTRRRSMVTRRLLV